MSKSCSRKGCSSVQSEFRFFLNRRRPPRLNQREFCGENCIQKQAESDLHERWRLLQREKNHHISRPKLGSILVELSVITQQQLDTAVRMQRENGEGKIGELLLRLGFIEEHHITVALSRQYGIPMIQLNHANARADNRRIIPAPVALCSNLVPVGFVDDRSALRVALSGPVDFGSQQAIRRMVGTAIMPYIGDNSAIQAMIEKIYPPEELDLNSLPTYSNANDLVDLAESIITSAADQRARNVQFELVEDFFWARLDYDRSSHHRVFRYQHPETAVEACLPAYSRPAAVAI
jgi:hypothetical protein